MLSRFSFDGYHQSTVSYESEIIGYLTDTESKSLSKSKLLLFYLFRTKTVSLSTFSPFGGLSNPVSLQWTVWQMVGEF